MNRLNRNCWLCGNLLKVIGRVEVRAPDGKHTLWVHKACEQDTRNYVRKVTAQLEHETSDLQRQLRSAN